MINVIIAAAGLVKLARRFRGSRPSLATDTISESEVSCLRRLMNEDSGSGRRVHERPANLILQTQGCERLLAWAMLLTSDINDMNTNWCL